MVCGPPQYLRTKMRLQQPWYATGRENHLFIGMQGEAQRNQEGRFFVLVRHMGAKQSSHICIAEGRNGEWWQKMMVVLEQAQAPNERDILKVPMQGDQKQEKETGTKMPAVRNRVAGSNNNAGS